MRKKIMAFLLTAAMVITTIPMNVFAQEVVEREENSTYEMVLPAVLGQLLVLIPPIFVC